MRIAIFEFEDKYTGHMTAVQKEFDPDKYKDSEIFKEVLCFNELNSTYTVIFADL